MLAKKRWCSNWWIHILFILMCAAILFPFLLILAVSFSNEKDVALYGYQLIPKKIDFSAYQYLFKNPDTILRAYGVTILVTVMGTVLSVVLMSMVAYPLSKRNMVFKQGITFYIFFTMLFSGGLVPTYILNTQYLHLNNTIWIYILPSLINVWHVFLLRTFFKSIPDSIGESALLDGAGEYRIFFTMILPLSKPALATVALLGALTRWNDWFTAMLYISDDKLITLQYLLQRILLNIQLLQGMSSSGNMVPGSILSMADLPSETVRMAMAIIAIGPMLLVFPFFQKYFVKGLTIGSVKG
ncbi:carbohydrate ABC transporter permease [Ructibacterium gallinarum]|uniref:Carbohydrate ABC transporter permease n=1 Tax=Ructibacterium gallinarum TaxID=2779355 RepID=A0A9D5M332_9FIRM|nr:carbohydrate ABC transporter permease [Ructibacterium gallinarum]MBE5039710.1 carbohydrate ABC transporter permease [Ructibacterium gallinarum]